METRKGSVLLVYPRYRYWLASSLEEPLGLLYVGTALKKAGWDVDFVDLTFEKSLSKIEDALQNNPVAVGMSVTSPLLDRAREVLDFIKARRPSLPVIMGGPHTSAVPESGLAEGFDYLLLGEGEESMVSLVEGLNGKGVSGVKGLCYPDVAGAMRLNPPEPIMDLDSIAFPDRSLVDYRRYEKVGLITMRGCPFRCYFCKPMMDQVFGRKMRRRTPSNVVQEVRGILQQMGDRIIHFRDDTFTFGKPDWLTEFRSILKESVPHGIRFHCSSRVDQINEEKLKIVKDAGCTQIFFGVESGSQKILDFYRKGTNPAQAVEAFRLCRKHKINTVSAIMLGAPEETREDLELTYNLVKKLKPTNWIVFITTPFPGNHLYRHAKENNLIRVSQSGEFDNAMNKRNLFLPMELKHLTVGDIRKYANKIDRYMIFLRMFRLSTLITVLRRPRSAYYKVLNLLRIGSESRVSEPKKNTMKIGAAPDCSPLPVAPKLAARGRAAA